MKLSSAADQYFPEGGDKNCLNSELWHACAGPLVYLPAIGSHVVYFPQGHSEQVSVSTNREVDAQIPNYPSLPPQLICQLHNVTMHADPDTDEVYAQMTLQPLNTEEQNKISFSPADLGSASKQPTNYFCKILTASDTSTHGGFSVPRRAAEKVFPPLNFTQQPPTQELIARDLHNNVWKFKHIFRGQPKRHLLTTGWSVFVTAKRLVAGDSIIFIWNEKNQLFLGIRRAIRPQTVLPSSVLSSDSMHLGLLAAAAHAAATSTRFTIFYNPRASPSEFVIPLAKYLKAVCHTRISVGMRFRMLFETDESSIRRYMGTVTSTSDLDPEKWPNSHWRSVKVGWDESAAGERQPRVSLWEIEALNTYPTYPSSFPLRLRRFSSFNGMKTDDMGLSCSPLWFWGDTMYQGMELNPWMQQRLNSSDLGMQNDTYHSMATAAAIQGPRVVDTSSLMQLQQPQAQDGQPPCFIEPQIMQGSESSAHILRSLSVVQPPAHSDIIQQHLLQQRSLSNMQMQQRHQYHQQPYAVQHFTDPSHKSVPYVSQAEPQFSSHSNFQLHQSAKRNAVDPVSPLHRLLGAAIEDDVSNSLLSFSCRPSKRIAVDPLSSIGVEQAISPQGDHLEALNSQNSVSLPPFPASRACLSDQGGNDPQNHLLFGVNIDSSPLVMQSSGDDVAFATSSYMSSNAADCSLNPKVISATCIDDSGFLLSSDNLGHANPDRTFVKVYKTGSPGRSLDISKFSSYHELRRELASMFGLEGQLEDPLRSGWQLVFVDRENDVLLLGDDPYHEFVNSVWCIKILSPQEVEEMGKLGLELLNSFNLQRPSQQKESSCGSFPSQREVGSRSSGLQSAGTPHF